MLILYDTFTPRLISLAIKTSSMATTKEMQGKRDYAKLLFIHEQLSQKDIALRIKVSAQTINKWANLDNWDSYRVSMTLSKEEQLKSL